MALPKIKLKHDKAVTIATGGSRHAVRWLNSIMMWSDLVSRLSVPHRTAETSSEYQHMPAAKRSIIKDVGGFVGGELSGERRKAENVKSRSVLTLDLDSVPEGVEIWPYIDSIFEAAAGLYSTHSHTPSAQRLRLVMPLSRPVTPDEYGAIARRIAEDIGFQYCDPTTFEPSRLMYWASCPVDAEYIFEYTDAEFLDADEVLRSYRDWTDVSEWPGDTKAELGRELKKQGDPTEKHGIVGAFCKVYDIPGAIAEFLPEEYKEAAPGRYTYTAGSTAGGLVLYEDGKFCYSHHGTDPASGMLVNAFDLVRLHKYRDLDEDTPEDVSGSRRPSYKAMQEFALSDKKVSYQLAIDRVGDAFEADEDVDTTWMENLEHNQRGLASTIDNFVLILTNDIRLKGAYYFDAFRERPVVGDDLPWLALEDRQTSSWTDADDAGLRRYIEKVYHIESAAKIRDAVELAMLENIRHPVREYLESLTWDGEKRLSDLFITYLGAEDCVYTRAVTRASLIGAVARIYRPGCKHDHMLVLVGPQGCRKSTTLAKLGKDWFSDSLYTVSGKDAYEQIQGYWIIEMGELAATRKAEAEQIKQFMSKQADSYRAAYARRTQEHPRQCAFFGSTNDSDFLKDSTGARRFWPVEVTNVGRKMADKLTEDLVDQIWAEAVAEFKAGAVWYLSDEEEDLAREVQAAHTEVSGKAGLVQDFLAREVPVGWDLYTLPQRLTYWGNAFKAEDPPETEPRTKVCALEIWCELFDGDPKQYTANQSRELNAILKNMPEWKPKSSIRIGQPYGTQRGFIKKE